MKCDFCKKDCSNHHGQDIYFCDDCEELANKIIEYMYSIGDRTCE